MGRYKLKEWNDSFKYEYAELLLWQKKLEAFKFSIQDHEEYSRADKSTHYNEACDIISNRIYSKLNECYSRLMAFALSDMITPEHKKMAKQIAYEKFKFQEEIRFRHIETKGRYPFEGWTDEDEKEYRQKVKADYVVIKLRIENQDKVSNEEIRNINSRIDFANLKEELPQLKE